MNQYEFEDEIRNYADGILVSQKERGLLWSHYLNGTYPSNPFLKGLLEDIVEMNG